MTPIAMVDFSFLMFSFLSFRKPWAACIHALLFLGPRSV
jgi:hypothetical protein